jgi:hypothetical protein
MDPLYAGIIGSIVRWAFMGIGAYLVAHHIITVDQATGLQSDLAHRAVLSLPLLAPLAWSIYQKYKGRVKFLTALESPAGTTEAGVDAKIDNGMGASVKTAGAVLLACVLAGAAFTIPACVKTPPNLSPAAAMAFKADQLLKDLQAASATAISLNAIQGKLHLSDKDTAIVRQFALVAGAGLNAYGTGATTLNAARLSVDSLALPQPGAATAVRAAFDQAVADHGAGASVLQVVRDAYGAFLGGLSIDGKKHPELVAVLETIGFAINAIPAQ